MLSIENMKAISRVPEQDRMIPQGIDTRKITAFHMVNSTCVPLCLS